jgi:hypothetical protein
MNRSLTASYVPSGLLILCVALIAIGLLRTHATRSIPEAPAISRFTVDPPANTQPLFPGQSGNR